MNASALDQQSYEIQMLSNMEMCWNLPTTLIKKSGDEEKVQSLLREHIEGNARAAWMSCLLRGTFSSNVQTHIASLAYLENLHPSRLVAYQVFASLPLYLFHPIDSESVKDLIPQSDKITSYRFAQRIAAFLINDELSLGLKAVLQREFGEVEKRAVVSEMRYRVIRELCGHGVIPDNRPEITWLLSETAESIQCIRNASVQGEEVGERISSQRDSFNRTKTYLDILKGKKEPSEARPYQCGIEHLDVMLSIPQRIDLAGKELAEQDSDFNKQFYTPYLSALTSFNGGSAKAKDWLGKQSKKIGRKKGQKDSEPRCRRTNTQIKSEKDGF